MHDLEHELSVWTESCRVACPQQHREMGKALSCDTRPLLSAARRSPDVCIGRTGSTRTGRISQTLPRKSWGKLSGSSIQHRRAVHPVEQGQLVTRSSFSRVLVAPAGCRHMQELGVGIPGLAHAAGAVLQPPSPRAWPETLLSATHGFLRQIGTFLCPGSLQNNRA